jgi:uncharacterized protein (DUF302 family)/uncharacterized membrane protein YidH (DUF202 family)
MTDRPPGSAADYLAAERTFLAWIRTGLALMGLGFVVARFGLFLQALQVGQPNVPSPTGFSPWFGAVLISLGIIINLGAIRNHIRLVQELKRGGSGFARPSVLAIATAVMLAILGLIMAIYVVSVRETKTAQETSMTSHAEHGIVTIPSHNSVDGTVQKLEHLLESKGVKLFTVIDHSGEAEKAGLKMPPTKVLIFGNPKAGTPLMIASPSIAIDLPLKILIREDDQGKVWISYNSPAYLQERHGFPPELMQNIAAVETLATKAAE